MDIERQMEIEREYQTGEREYPKKKVQNDDDYSNSDID